MLEGLRNRVAGTLDIVARRMSAEPRYVETSRVPYSPRTLAGVPITPDTAVTVSTVWACIRYISQTVAVPSWHAMRTVNEGSVIQGNNPVDWLINKRPNPEWSSFQFRETLTHWAMRWGNGYAEIEPDMLGRPFAMWPIHPERVDVCRSDEDGYDSYGDEIPAGSLFYEVNNGSKAKTVLSRGRMFHIRGFGEGPVGVNVIHYAAQSIGWARAAQLFASSFFGNGATPSSVVINKKSLSPAGLEAQKKEFQRLYGGGPRNAHKTAHLDNDADLKEIGVNPKNSQLLETHQFLVEEVCRWFGVPPHKVMHLQRATFSNIEHQAIEVVVDSITPWAKRFEDEADYKLFGQNRRSLYTKMNLNALMRGDSQARLEYYKGMHLVGAYSPNRILELEHENTIGADGDIHVMQEQMAPLSVIANKVLEPDPAGGPDDNTPAQQNRFRNAIREAANVEA